MKQVLVVDDSPVIRKIVRRILDGLRLQSSDAADGGQAFEVCARNMPDAIFVDSSLPDMDSCEFMRRLRGMPEGEKPRLVFCTSEYEVALIARALHAGADDILIKPFDRDAVQAKFGVLSAA